MKCIFVRLSPKSKMFQVLWNIPGMKFYKNSYGGRCAVPYWPTRHGRRDEHDEADLRMYLATKHSRGITCLHCRHGCKLRLSSPWDQVVWTQFFFLLWMMATKREVLRYLEYTLKIVTPCNKSRVVPSLSLCAFYSKHLPCSHITSPRCAKKINLRLLRVMQE